MDKNSKNRILGLFWGQLVGDALGTRYEFDDAQLVKEKISKDIDNKLFLPIKGQGPFRLGPGRFTDDSELALGLWYSLLIKEKYDLNHISNIFYSWYVSEPFDIGNSTRCAFESGSSLEKMKSNAKKYNISSLSNGCLMKISGLGAINILKLTDSLTNKTNFTEYIRKVCELTNPHSLCIDMCISYVVGLECAIKTGDPKKAYSSAVSVAKYRLTKDILNDSCITNQQVKILSDINDMDSQYLHIDTIKNKNIGYIGFAFQNAFYQLLNNKSNKSGFYNGLIQTILLGGDTDTNACIAGALLGACYGISCISSRWIKTVYQSEIDYDRELKYKPINHRYISDLLNEKLTKICIN